MYICIVYSIYICMCSTVKLASGSRWAKRGVCKGGTAFKGHFVTYAKKISNLKF